MYVPYLCATQNYKPEKRQTGWARPRGVCCVVVDATTLIWWSSATMELRVRSPSTAAVECRQSRWVRTTRPKCCCSLVNRRLRRRRPTGFPITLAFALSSPSFPVKIVAQKTILLLFVAADETENRTQARGDCRLCFDTLIRQKTDSINLATRYRRWGVEWLRQLHAICQCQW